MFSAQDQREMLADARDPKRREAFRQAKRQQEKQIVSGADYLEFLQVVHKIFPLPRTAEKAPAKNFRL